MYLDKIHINNHDILGNIDISLINPRTNKPYSIIAFVGENGCGKTTLLAEISKLPNHRYVFLRQNSMFVGLSNEHYKLIAGKELLPTKNVEDSNEDLVNSKESCIELLKSLNDETIIDIYKSGKLDNSRCGGEGSRIIDGKTDFFDLGTLSSGQQEILLKLKLLEQAQASIDFVLLDEPETSLHPRWQKRIVDLVRDIVTDKNGNEPQLFIATHSEKVLESLIVRDDVLIVRLFKEDEIIKYETIDEIDLCLPTPTFAELDYVVFHIPSLDYHDQLFTYFGAFFDKDTSTAIDLKIERKAKKVFGKNNIEDYEKERINARFNKVYTTKMLPTYIRDFFHHPNEIIPPTEEELIKSIEMMRALIKFMKDNGAKEVEETE